MACTSPSLTVESYEDITSAKTSGTDDQKQIYRRRHSSFHPRRKSYENAMDGDEGLLLRVCLLKDRVSETNSRLISRC